MIFKTKHEGLIRLSANRLLLIMKLIVALILLNITTAWSNGFAQNITLKAKNISLVQAMKSIQKQSGHTFFLSGKSLANIKIDVDIEVLNIDKAMDKLLHGKPAEWVMEDGTIVIKPRPVQAVRPTPNVSEKKNVNTVAIVQQTAITGTVTDAFDDSPILGASVMIAGTSKGTTTDNNGVYELSANEGDSLVFSFVGFEAQKVAVGKVKIINVRLSRDMQSLEETVVTAFGARARREDVVGSITSVNPSELKIPSSNLTTALAGRAAGIIGFQRSGEPGADNAEFFIRGVTTFGYQVNPLILIDNVESSTTDLARLQVDDIESFSILKDASAAAMYGARGANGVLLITTKQGNRESVSIFLRMENSLSQPTKQVELADPITYMKLANDAVVGRNPLSRTPYSLRQIEFTPPGGSLEYPAVNWMDELVNNYAMNQRASLNVRGGGAVARYFVSGSFNRDNGILKVPEVSNFNNNVDLKSYTLRSNVNIDLTPKTELVVRLSGNFDDYNGPLQNATKAYRDIMRAVPTKFLPFFPPGENYQYLQHIMFGNAEIGNFLNPYAEMVKGYREYNRSRMMAQLEMNQKLDFVTEGLSFTGRITTNRNAYYEIRREYDPYFYEYTGLDNYGNYLYEPYNEGTDYLGYGQGGTEVNSAFQAQGILTYVKRFGDDHSINSSLVGTMLNELRGNPGSLQLSLPHRNLNIAGRFSYGYLGKYIVEANFGYNGSERFNKDHRFGFFPSIGMVWHASKESFFELLQPIISNFRLRGTYGMVGQDAIGSAEQRFYYLSEVNMNSEDRSWSFGPTSGETVSGVNVTRYPNPDITWETSFKTNVALELGLFNNVVEIQADWFNERRTSIFMQRAHIPATMGLSAPIHANIGEAKGSGFDMQGSYNKRFYNGMWIQGMLNFTYATSEFVTYEEPQYQYPWLHRAGYPINIARGYIAERLFIDEQEVRNSPEQQLGGQVMAGDIKYVDVNGDGIISSLDMVPLGYPTVPEINYGFGLSMGYRGFDFNVMFTGLARESFFIDPEATGPFRSYTYVNNGVTETLAGTMQNNVLQVYADNHWSLENRDLYALFPRLSWTAGNPNNEVTSTWWMRNGAFLRLKQLTLGYTFTQKDTGMLNRLNVKSLRIYGDGLNLLTFSKFKLWDVEMAGNGLNYPIQRVFNLGITLDL